MVIDIPDGLGEPRPGRWLDAERSDDDGARLFNVAISRSQHHLVFVANVGYLDKKLPAQSLLRGMLSYAQAMGRTIDVRDVLSYYPIIDDLKRYGRPIDLDPNTLRTGLYNQHDFDKVCLPDLSAAERSILIFSGFVTPQRTRSYEAILRSKIAEGIAVRCVARPPHNNGSIPYDDGRAALNALETMGCVVDTRKDTHEKLVIIDGEILWFGSLNPLSHTTQTGEVMARLVSRELTQQMAAFVAIKPSRASETYANLAMIKETHPARAAMGVPITWRRRAAVLFGGARNKPVAGPKVPQQRGRPQSSTELMRRTAQNAGRRWFLGPDNSVIFSAAPIIRDAREPLHQTDLARQKHQASEARPHRGGERQIPLEIPLLEVRFWRIGAADLPGPAGGTFPPYLPAPRSRREGLFRGILTSSDPTSRSVGFRIGQASFAGAISRDGLAPRALIAAIEIKRS